MCVSLDHIRGAVQEEEFLALRTLQFGELSAKTFFFNQLNPPKFVCICIKYQFSIKLGFFVWISVFPPNVASAEKRDKGKIDQEIRI